MGSRGAFLKTGGFKEYRYHTIMRYNNVRFIVQNDIAKGTKLPERSKSKWTTYAVLDRHGQLKSIAFYNGSRKMTKQIDFDHKHNGLKPHVHSMNPKTGLRDKSIVVRKPTAKESDRIQRIKDFYKRHDLKTKADRINGGK